jgi:hypothetical protein
MPCSIATLLYKHFPFCQVFLEANFNFADTVIALARFEGAEETVVAAPYVSAVLNFAPHPIGSPVKGSRQLRCRGVE